MGDVPIFERFPTTSLVIRLGLREILQKGRYIKG